MRWWRTAVVPSHYAAKKSRESLGSYLLPGFTVLAELFWHSQGLTEVKGTHSHGHTFPPPLSIRLSLLLQIATITASCVAHVENRGRTDMGSCNCISCPGLISCLMALFAATEYENEN